MTFLGLLSALEINSEDTLRRFGNNQTILERFLLKFPADPTMSLLLSTQTTKDAEQFELYAHTLKGVANNLGLCKLGALSSEAVAYVRNGNVSAAFQMFPAIQSEYTRIIDILQIYKNEKES